MAVSVPRAMRRLKFTIVMGGALVAILLAALVRPSSIPDYLQDLEPISSGAGRTVYEINDADGRVEQLLTAECTGSSSNEWSEMGSITYTDRCNTYIGNRFLTIEWGQPRGAGATLRIETRRRSLMGVLFNSDL